MADFRCWTDDETEMDANTVRGADDWDDAVRQFCAQRDIEDAHWPDRRTVHIRQVGVPGLMSYDARKYEVNSEMVRKYTSRRLP